MLGAYFVKVDANELYFDLLLHDLSILDSLPGQNGAVVTKGL